MFFFIFKEVKFYDKNLAFKKVWSGFWGSDCRILCKKMWINLHLFHLDHDPVQLKWMRIRICNLRNNQKYALVTKYLLCWQKLHVQGKENKITHVYIVNIRIYPTCFYPWPLFSLAALMSCTSVCTPERKIVQVLSMLDSFTFPNLKKNCTGFAQETTGNDCAQRATDQDP